MADLNSHLFASIDLFLHVSHVSTSMDEPKGDAILLESIHKR
jgi:hypothetical protein